MLMKYKDFKFMSNEDMKKVFGGSAAVLSACNMECKGGEKIAITDCSGTCGCSEVNQGCACLKDLVVLSTKLCPAK